MNKAIILGGLLFATGSATQAMMLVGEGLRAVQDVNRHEAAKTDLHHAAAQGEADTCLDLLEMGADINSSTPQTAFAWAETPLHCAAKYGHVDTCQKLLRFKGDMKFSYQGNWTPLHAAAETNQVEACNVLLDNGFDPEIVSDGGFTVIPRTCLDIAETNGNLPLCKQILTRTWYLPPFEEKKLFEVAQAYVENKVVRGFNWLCGRTPAVPDTAYQRVFTFLCCLKRNYPSIQRDMRLYLLGCTIEGLGADVFELLLPRIIQITKEKPLAALKIVVPAQLLPLVHERIFRHTLVKIEELLLKNYLHQAKFITGIMPAESRVTVVNDEKDPVQSVRLQKAQDAIDKYRTALENARYNEGPSEQERAERALDAIHDAFANLFNQNAPRKPTGTDETYIQHLERKIAETLAIRELIELLYPHDFAERCGADIYENIGRLMDYKKSNEKSTIIHKS